MPFAELLARSSFSFLRGASHPEEMVGRAKELGLEAIALCDRDGLYGSARALSASRETEQRVIVGTELGIEAEGEELERRSSWGATARKSAERAVVALLVENGRGYENLCRLITRAHEGLPKGQCALRPEWLAAHAEGLWAIVPVPRIPEEVGRVSPADAPSNTLFEVLRDVFDDRALVAATRRLDGLDEARIATAERWSARWGLQAIASARPLYHARERKPLADVLHCIRHSTTLERAGADLEANAEAFLRSDREMRKLFREREAWIDRTGEVASALRFSLGELRYQFPCTLAPGESADEKLRRLTEEGARRRYPDGVPAKVSVQIEKELGLIEKLEVAPYFLSTWEIVEIARRRRILCQGRGSAANSAVCYVLGITAVNPARSSLLFERFLSVERREPPDIDIDFEHERREEVIQEIYERWGRERAAMVSEVISYRGRSSLREVGKVFGLSPDRIDRLSGLVGHWDDANTAEARFGEVGFDGKDERLHRILARARELSGFPRHLSIHVGGFVLSASPLTEVAPIEPARMPDRTVIPWDKDDLETLGFFKIDVLGLGMLTAIRKTLSLIHADGGLRVKSGETFDPIDVLSRVPPEDPEVYALASRADTIGVFQIESRAQMAMLPRLRPARFYDLVIEVAIVRPGPIQGGMVHPYLRRRNGEEPIVCPHPDLEPILERTLGVPLFQEQVMQIAIVGGGYSGGQADQLRRDMAAWKKTGRLLRHRDRLLEGFSKKGISRQFGEALFEQIKGFGEYGFPESHAASFALLVYVSAWQKAHHPVRFACALLNSQPMGFYSPSSILRDAQKHGVEVRDVDVTKSSWDSTLELDAPRDTTPSGIGQPVRRGVPESDPALRLGFRLVKGIREHAAVAIEAARAERPFSSLDDLVRRTGLRKNEIEAFAEAGVLEPLVPGRRQALWKARAPRAGDLYEALDSREAAVDLPALAASEQLVLDYGRKGLSVSDHPMRHLRDKLGRRGVITTEALQETEAKARVRVAGLVLTRQRPGTASGVVFITLEDETGTANLILWSRVFEEFHAAAVHASMLLATGRVERQVTIPKQGTPGFGAPTPPVPVVHLVVESLERLDVPGRDVAVASRDFH